MIALFVVGFLAVAIGAVRIDDVPPIDPPRFRQGLRSEAFMYDPAAASTPPMPESAPAAEMDLPAPGNAPANNIVVVDDGANSLPSLPSPIAYDKPQDKLDLALNAVKEDIIKKSKEIESETKWMTDVEDIVKVYNAKMERVKESINQLRLEVKELYKKKKANRKPQDSKTTRDEAYRGHHRFANSQFCFESCQVESR